MAKLPPPTAPVNHRHAPEENVGHGHVHPRADGKVEKCGGPDAGCPVCVEELRSAKAGFCIQASLQKTEKGTMLLGCRHQPTHWGPCDFQRPLGLLEDLHGDLKGAKLDRAALTQAGVPWFTCGWCKFSGPHFKGLDADHAECENKALGIKPPQMFDGARIGLCFAVVKTSIEGGFGIVRQEPNADGGYKHEVLARDEDWDSVVIKMAAYCGDMPVSVPA